MGAEQSATQQSSLKFLKEEGWESIGRREDRIYGDIKVFQSKFNNSHQVAVVQRLCSNEEDFNKLFIKYQKMASFNEIPGMIKLYEISHQKDDGFCSNMYKLSISFEYHQVTLQRVLEERIQMNRRLTTFELMEMTKQLLITLAELERRRYIHGDLRPQNIMVHDGLYKLSDTHNMDQYKKFIVGLEEYCYLSPEMFSQMASRTMRPIGCKRASDIFTFGLTILSIGVNSHIQQIYNYDTYLVSSHQLDNLLEQFRMNHGPQFMGFVSSMLRLEPELRPTFEELHLQAQNLSLIIQSEHHLGVQAQVQQSQTQSSQILSHSRSQQISNNDSQIQQQHLITLQNYSSQSNPPHNHEAQQATQNAKPQGQGQPSPNQRYKEAKSRESSKGNSPNNQYQYSSRKPAINASFLHKLEPAEPQILCQETNNTKRNWASDFLNDEDTVVHVPCNPGEDYLQVDPLFKPVTPQSDKKELQLLDQNQPQQRIRQQQPRTPSSLSKPSTTLTKQIAASRNSASNASLKRPKTGFYKKENPKAPAPQAQNKKWVR